MSFSQNFSVIILFLTIFQICTQLKADDEGNFTFLITGGYRPPKHTFTKNIVSIRWRSPTKFFGDNHICGGSILSPRVILTAAHCVHDTIFGGTRSAFNYRVVTGAPNRLRKVSGTQVIDVDYITMHPGYFSDHLRNDVAIMHLKEDIELDGVSAQMIPVTDVPPQVGNFCTVVGWGRIFEEGPLSGDAMYVNIQTYDNKVCEKEPWFSAPEMICAGDEADLNKDSCAGDSGAPMICNGMVAGIVSFGRECASGDPGFYTNVWNYRQWIRENNGCSISVHFGIILSTFLFCIAAAS